MPCHNDDDLCNSENSPHYIPSLYSPSKNESDSSRERKKLSKKPKVEMDSKMRKQAWKESQQVEQQIRMLNEMEETKNQKLYIPAWQQYQQRVQSQTAVERMPIASDIRSSSTASSIKTLEDVLAAIQRIEKPSKLVDYIYRLLKKYF